MNRFFIVNERVKANCINAINQIPDDGKMVVEIKERTRTLEQNSKLHALLSQISSKCSYQGKKRSIEFWKGLFVSAWQIATKKECEIVEGLEGELINIRESTATMSARKISEIIEYIYAYCAMNDIKIYEVDYA